MGIIDVIREKRQKRLRRNLTQVSEEFESVSLTIHMVTKNGAPMDCLGWPCSKCPTKTCYYHSWSERYPEMLRQKERLEQRMKKLEKQLSR